METRVPQAEIPSHVEICSEANVEDLTSDVKSTIGDPRAVPGDRFICLNSEFLMCGGPRGDNFVKWTTPIAGGGNKWGSPANSRTHREKLGYEIKKGCDKYCMSIRKGDLPPTAERAQKRLAG